MSTHLEQQQQQSPPAFAPTSSSSSGRVASPPPRSRRLRGLSLLRNYTHGHLLSHNNSSGAGGQTLDSSRSLSRSVTAPEGREAENRSSGEGGGGASSAERSAQSPDSSQPASPNHNSSGPSGWLSTVGGRSGLSRAASQPQSTETQPPAEVARARAENMVEVPSLSTPDASTRRQRDVGSTQQRHGGGPSTLAPSYSSAARDFARLDIMAFASDDGGNGSGSGSRHASRSHSRSHGRRRHNGSTGSARSGRSARSHTREMPTGLQNETTAMDEGSDSAGGPSQQSQMPSVRFTAHQDPRSARPSLAFNPIQRTLPSSSSTIRVGRYSEKDGTPHASVSTPSDAPIGFKSKVVSRRHCELWCESGQWYIRDVKSSSGTFLNHIRLSPAGVQSKPYALSDGDLVQLGIDFKGGEEMIFRCVKIRVECNRGWQKGLNNFNTSTHKRLRNLAKPSRESDTASTSTSECSICLLGVAPCQSLFVAPCSHVWHYKCIRPILIGNMYPQFLCPNCRAVSDLEAEVDELDDGWDNEADMSAQDLTEIIGETAEPSNVQANDDGAHQDANGEVVSQAIDRMSLDEVRTPPEDISAVPAALRRENTASSTSLGGGSGSDDQSALGSAIPRSSGIRTATSSNPSTAASHADEDETSHPGARDIPTSGAATGAPQLSLTSSAPGREATASPSEGPMTPRNDAGPFVFDGGAIQASTESRIPA